MPRPSLRTPRASSPPRAGYSLLRGLLIGLPIGIGAATTLLVAHGCLITSPSHLVEPEPTAPFLNRMSAQPPPGKVLVVDFGADGGNPSPIDISADFVSQDQTEPGQLHTVSAALYIDYGYPPRGDGPFYGFIPVTLDSSMETGGLQQVERRTVDYTLAPDVIAPTGRLGLGLGCHTLTLILSHEFDERSVAHTHCPVCEGDSSSITWTLVTCDSSLADAGSCDVVDLSGCWSLTNTCATISAATASPRCPDGGA